MGFIRCFLFEMEVKPLKFILEVDSECLNWPAIDVEVLLEVGDSEEQHFQCDFLEEFLLSFIHLKDWVIEVFLQSPKELVLQLLQQFQAKLEDFQSLILLKAQQEQSTSAQLVSQWKRKGCFHFVKHLAYLTLFQHAQRDLIEVIPLFQCYWLPVYSLPQQSANFTHSQPL